MRKNVIEVKNVSKEYRLGVFGTGMLTSDLKRWWYRVRGKEDPFTLVTADNDRTKKSDQRYVWALQDINFEIKKGEILGIIGRNGAGKSTLLKILSQVTPPSSGSILAKGRIASLLEVGTGMHPELTGRENIFLNGSILGMSKAEITKKLDEIVDFSGCSRYIDTPLKRYSSGMKVRLGFAVAAFLEPEILIVDEVLAVGDAEFQKKAIGKIQDVQKGEGRTVLFVSHNMGSIKALCHRAIVLDQGRVLFDGEVDKGIKIYLNQVETVESTLEKREDRIGNGRCKFNSIQILNQFGQATSEMMSGDNIFFRINFNLKFKLDPRKFIFTLNICDPYGVVILSFNSEEMGFQMMGDKGDYTIELNIPKLNLRAGNYSVTLFSSFGGYRNEDYLDVIERATRFTIHPTDFWGNGTTSKPMNAALINGSLKMIHDN